MDVCGSPPSETIVLYGAVFGTSDNATVSLGWNPISDADGYVLKRDGTVIFTADSGTTVNYLDTPGAGDYDYEVIAFNSGGEGSSDTLNILITPEFFVVAEESVEFSSSDSLDLVSPTPLQVGDVLTLTWGIYRLTGFDFDVTAPQFTTPSNLKSSTGNGSNNVGIGGGYVEITAGNVGTINWAVAFPSEASGIAVLRVVRGIPIGTLFFSSQNLNASAGFAGGVFEYKIGPRTQDQFSQLAAISIGNNGITADPAMFGAQSFSGGNISMTIAYINVPANTNPTFDITMTGEVVASARNDLSIDSS
jgi:hypothetical protein